MDSKKTGPKEKHRQTVGNVILLLALFLPALCQLNPIRAQNHAFSLQIAQKAEHVIRIPDRGPYRMHKPGDLIVAGAVTGLGVWGAIRDLNSTGITPTEIAALDPVKINRIDRHVTSNWNTDAGKVSDYFFLGSIGLGASLFAFRETRRDILKLVAIGGEAAMVTYGLTFLTKTFTRRTRPFVYNPDLPLSEKTSRDTKQAFFSGHTSISAVFTFFTAKVIHDYGLAGDWKWAVWTAAALIPATTGYLRVRAGKHFITDVVAGYLVGAGAGILVPHLHRSKSRRLQNVSAHVGPGNFSLAWRF